MKFWKILGVGICLILTMSGNLVWNKMEDTHTESLIRWVVLGMFVAGLAGIVVIFRPKPPESPYVCDKCGWKGWWLLDHIQIVKEGKCRARPRLNPKYKREKSG